MMVPEITDFFTSLAFLDTVGDFFGGFFSSLWAWIVDVGKAIGGYFSGLFDDVGRWVIWFCVILLIVAGLAGTIIPFLPGTILIVVGCFLHYFGLGRADTGLTWFTLGGMVFLCIASMVVDGISGAIGAKWFGSTRWGAWGAILGGIVGMFFSLPGIIIGPIAGVFLFEMIFAKRKLKDAGNSTVGTVVGGGAGIVARVAIGGVMVIWYLLDLLF